MAKPAGALDPPWLAHLPPGTESGALDLTAGGSLVAVAAERWRREPARPVLRDTDDRWLSAGELDERSRILAGRLQAAGLAAGDRLILCAPTSAALVCAYVAALRAGLIVAPVNPGYTRVEVERVVRAARPAAALVDGAERADWVAGAAPPGAVVSGFDLAGLPPAGGAAPELDGAQPADPALLLYTSGTTGAPKGALLSHGNLLSNARAVALAWRWMPDDRLLLALPLFHMHGLGVGVNGSLVSGGQLVLRPGFDPGDVAERCRGGGVSMFFGVPAMYQRLLAADRAAALAGLRLIVSGSAPLPEAQSDAVAQATGQRPLERYGMTETVMLTSNLIDGPRKPGHVGLPLPGVRVRLAAGNQVEVSGPNVLGGYDRGGGDPSAAEIADAEAFTGDGWFRTGDLGELDAEGHLRLVGRSKELIITGGFNVHPREVEEAISQFPGVREAAVVGRPSERWGEAVTAVVVADRRLDPVELRDFAAQRLASYKVPKSFEFVDELPRNALGKLLRHQL